MDFVTTQQKLAEKIKYTPTHLSLFKNRKDQGYSEKFVEALSEVTGISPKTLMTASPKKLDKLFKEFFAEQRLLKKINHFGKG